MTCEVSLPFCMLSPIWYVLPPLLPYLSQGKPLSLWKSPWIPTRLLLPSSLPFICLITCVFCFAFSYLWCWPLSQALISFRAGVIFIHLYSNPTCNKQLINSYQINEISLSLCSFRNPFTVSIVYASIASQTSKCNWNFEVAVNPWTYSVILNAKYLVLIGKGQGRLSWENTKW